MRKSYYTTRFFTITIIATALLLTACSQKRYLTPFENSSTRQSGPYYQVTRDNLSFAVEPLVWRPGSKGQHSSKRLPVWVVIANGSDKPIEVNRSQFTLKDHRLSQFRQWTPAGFFMAFRGSNFSFFYAGPFPFYWYPSYKRDIVPDRMEYRQLGKMKSTDRSLLPEVMLQPGDSISGTLFFEAPNGMDRIYTISWRPDRESNRKYQIIFSVRTA